MLSNNRQLTPTIASSENSSTGYYWPNPEHNYLYPSPTAVTLASFSQGSLTNGVQLDWSTATEVGLLGFNLYRSDELEGVKQKLNVNLIPALTPGDLLGNAYQFTDGTAVSGKTYTYWIELVMLDGNQESDPLTLSGALLAPAAMDIQVTSVRCTARFILRWSGQADSLSYPHLLPLDAGRLQFQFSTN